jgi:vancomycin resistance protein YoaR
MQTEPPDVSVPTDGAAAESTGDVVDSAIDEARPLRPYHRRLWVWLVMGVVVLVGGVVAVLALPGERKVPEGTSVLGVAVGGLGEDDLRKAVDGPVRARVERAVQVQVETESFALAPADAGVRFDSAATVDAVLASRQPNGAVLPVVTVDQDALESRLGEHKLAARDAVAKLAAPTPVLEAKGDASFRASSKGVSVQAGRAGWAVDEKTGAAAYVRAVRTGLSEVRLPVVAIQPKTGVADQLIGSFTTQHGCCQPRVTNIHRIATIVNGTVIKPGAMFSLNKAAGQRTAAQGFVSAPAIVEGELEDQVGGGVSQFSTTLFNAAWFAGLPVLRHQPHSKYISRYPPGREATLDWGAIDQVIRNDTGAPVVIRAAFTGTSLTVALYGHTGQRKVVSTTGARHPRDGGGFSISVSRKVYAGDTVKGRDELHWTYTGLD